MAIFIVNNKIIITFKLIIIIILFIIKVKPTQPTKETTKLVGTFYTDQNYIDLFVRLHGNYYSNFTSTGENTLDKFGQMRTAAIRTLIVIIKCYGRKIIPYAEEIISYLIPLYLYDPKVIHIISFNSYIIIYILCNDVIV